MHYDMLRRQDSADYAGCTAIIDSIEKRWAKADQEVFIAAVFLNPFFKIEPFSSGLRLWSQASILSLLKRLYQRFFSTVERADELEESLRQLYYNLEEYLEGTGICEGLADYAVDVENQAKQTGSSPDPLKVYKGISSINGCPPPLFKLANHILSICPNSASCERLFSVFGNTLTKLRNRLGNTTLTSLAELKMHIRDEHMRDADTKKRMKRFFGAAANVSPPQADIAAPEPASQAQSISPSPAAIVPSAPTTIVPSAPAAIVPSAPAAIVPSAPATIISQVSSPTAISPQFHGAPAMDALMSAADLDADDMEIDPVVVQASNTAGNDFARIVQGFAKLADADQDEEDAQTFSCVPWQVSIAKLFDFTKAHWVSKHERSASRSLNEELELYELLDLDAPGEEDVDLEIDPTLDSVFV